MSVQKELDNLLGEHDLPYEYTGKLIEEWSDAKGDLNVYLGLSEENDYRIEIGEVEENSDDWQCQYSNCIRLISDFINWFSPDYSPDYGNKKLYHYNTGDSIKLSKYLAENQMFFLEFIRHHGYMNSALKELQLINHDGRADKTKLKSFITTFFQMIKDNCQLIISTNPSDFIGVNYNASYSSCYNIQKDGSTGEYFNATIALCRDNFTAVSYVLNKKGKKVGRSWLYIFPETGQMIQPRSYGSYNQVNRKRCREWIQDQLSDSNQWVRKELRDFSGYSGHARPVYFDNAWLEYSRDKAETDGDTQPPFINFKQAICLECGKETEELEGATCKECDGVNFLCECCEEYLNEDRGIYINGEWICDDCRSEHYSFCDDCEEYYYSNDGTGYYIESCERYVCESCIDNYTRCEECGEYFDSSDTIEVENHGYVCQECFNNGEFYECGDCGYYFKTDDCVFIEDKERDVCPDCADSYNKCEECGTYFENECPNNCEVEVAA